MQHNSEDKVSASAFRQNLNLQILTKPSFRISKKDEPHSHNQASAAKILPDHQLQNLDQTKP